MKLKRIILGLACLAMLNGSASATTYNLWGGGGTSNLNAGWSYTSSFDANLLFTPLVDVITNATLTLNFLGSNQTSYVGTNTQITNSGYVGTTYWQTADTTQYFIDPLDSVKVLIGKNGGQTVTGSDVAGAYSSSVITSTPLLVTGTNAYWNPGFWSVCGSWPNFYSCYFSGYYSYSPILNQFVGNNNTLVNTTGNKGSFSVIANLNSTSLGLLESTGLLRYGFTVTGGGVALESATLTFNAAAPVPEPETYAMLLAGLGLLGFTTKRRKNKNLVA